MGFPSPLSAPQIAAIRAGNFHSSAYVLATPAEVVFSARVNQATFGNAFASIVFDTIVTGAITDVLDGQTIYISNASEDTFNYVFELRARGNGSAGTTLNINETSFNIQDDQYITVCKPVVGHEKLGRYVNKDMKTDWDNTFRELLPLVTGLQSAYGKKLVASSAIFSFPAVGFATTYGAAISSWLWDADGGSFANGTVATDAQPDIEYTTAGVYWPRVVVTDDGGRSNWFTMPVFVMSSDMSDTFIIDGVENLAISSKLGVGDELNFAAFSEEFVGIPSRSIVVVWEEPNYNGDTTPIIDNVLFVGRLRKETPKSRVEGVEGPQPDTSYNCEGFLAQMNRIRSPQLALTNKNTPTVFQQINRMTQWRIVVFVLSEFSTFTNICSLRFDDETETYRNREDSTSDKGLLASVNGILSARKALLNIARQGEIYAATSAVFQSTAERNALDTIHSFTTADIFQYSIADDRVPTVGSVDAFGGGYNSNNNKVRIIRAVAPAVASLEAQGGVKPIDGILLTTDATGTAQQEELEIIAANALADSNPKDTPNMDVLDGFYFMSPTNFQWWGMLLAASDNNRGISYTAADRFLLSTIDITYDNVAGTWIKVTPTLPHETEGTGAKTISQIQPGAIPPALPTIPPIAAYPNFPALPDLYLPTGWTDLNVPAIGNNDGAIVISPTDPSALINTKTEVGSVGMYWDGITQELFLTTELNETDNPTWNSVFTADSPMEIKDAKFDPFSTGAYVLVNDNSDNSELYFTSDIFASVPNWTATDTTLDDINYTTIRTTATPDEVYIFGLDDRVPPATVNLLDGNGNEGLDPSSLISPHANSQNAPGTYDSVGDWYDGATTPNGARGCNIQYALPARASLKSVSFTFGADRTLSPTIGADRTYEISLDGVSAATGAYGVGIYFNERRTLLHTYPTEVEGDTVLFHVSMDKDDSLGADVEIFAITMTLIDNGKVKAAFRRSSNSGGDFASLKNSGVEINSSALPGYATGAIDTSAYLPADDVLRGTDDFGLSFGSKAGSATSGTYAKAIWAYGQTANVDTIIATDALFDTTKSMINIINGSQTDITPDDGVDIGLVVGRDAICMSRISDEYMWGIFDFNGTYKLAYTDDGGITPWTISAVSLTVNANYIRVKDSKLTQVYLSDTDVIKYSSDGGINFRDKTTLSLDIQGIEVR